MPPSRRNPFTLEERDKLAEFLSQFPSEDRKRPTIYAAFAEENPTHSAEAWRDHYRKPGFEYIEHKIRRMKRERQRAKEARRAARQTAESIAILPEVEESETIRPLETEDQEMSSPLRPQSNEGSPEVGPEGKKAARYLIKLLAKANLHGEEERSALQKFTKRYPETLGELDSDKFDVYREVEGLREKVGAEIERLRAKQRKPIKNDIASLLVSDEDNVGEPSLEGQASMEGPLIENGAVLTTEDSTASQTRKIFVDLTDSDPVSIPPMVEKMLPDLSGSGEEIGSDKNKRKSRQNEVMSETESFTAEDDFALVSTIAQCEISDVSRRAAWQILESMYSKHSAASWEARWKGNLPILMAQVAQAVKDLAEGEKRVPAAENGNPMDTTSLSPIISDSAAIRTPDSEAGSSEDAAADNDPVDIANLGSRQQIEPVVNQTSPSKTVSAKSTSRMTPETESSGLLLGASNAAPAIPSVSLSTAQDVLQEFNELLTPTHTPPPQILLKPWRAATPLSAGIITPTSGRKSASRQPVLATPPVVGLSSAKEQQQPQDNKGRAHTSPATNLFRDGSEPSRRLLASNHREKQSNSSSPWPELVELELEAMREFQNTLSLLAAQQRVEGNGPVPLTDQTLNRQHPRETGPSSAATASPQGPQGIVKRAKTAEFKQTPSPSKKPGVLSTSSATLKHELKSYAEKYSLKTRQVIALYFACSATIDMSVLDDAAKWFSAYRPDLEDPDFLRCQDRARRLVWSYAEDVAVLSGTEIEHQEIEAKKGRKSVTARQKFLAQSQKTSVSQLQLLWPWKR